LSVNKVNWEDVGRVTEPGRYMLRFGNLLITAEDIEIWKQFPGVDFTLVAQLSAESTDEFKLGAFDIGPAHETSN
jgi:hypothetical protein